MAPEGRARALSAGVFAAVAAVFLPALRYPFLNWDAQNAAANQPLTWLSLAADRALWGVGPFGHHLTNVLLHALGAALLFQLARRLKLGEAAAVFAALFWALHPLRVESVAWITERRDVLCGVASLGAALCYARGREEPVYRRAALALAVLAMAAKVFAVVLPAVWLVLDLRLYGAPRWKDKLAYVPFSLTALGMNLAARAGGAAAVPLAEFGVSHRLAQAFYGLAFYPWKTVAPAGLAPLYERSVLLEPRIFTAAAAAVLSTAVLLALCRRRAPGVLHAALAYAILLLPALGFFKSGRMIAADRWSYLPAIPLSLLAAGALERALDERGFRAAAAALVLALAALTRAQLPVWSSDAALWTRAMAASPLSAFAVERLADAERAAGLAGQADGRRAHAAALRRFVADLAARVKEGR